MPWRYTHRLVKPYVVTARGRQWDDHMVDVARGTATRQLEFDDAMGSVGLGVVVLHLGDDGIYLVVQSWAKDFQSRLSIFSGMDVDGWLDDVLDTRPASRSDGIPSGT